MKLFVAAELRYRYSYFFYTWLYRLIVWLVESEIFPSVTGSQSYMIVETHSHEIYLVADCSMIIFLSSRPRE